MLHSNELGRFLWQETLTMNKNGYICFSKVGKICSISECSPDEGSDIKGVQSSCHSSCHGDDPRLMSNGEVVRIVTIEPKVVSIRFD